MALTFDHRKATEARENADLTRAGAARKLGLARQTLINVEDGMSVPGGDTLARMASVYGVGVGFFFTGEGEGSRSTDSALETDKAPIPTAAATPR